jgi:uncharacterized membrane protein
MSRSTCIRAIVAASVLVLVALPGRVPAADPELFQVESEPRLIGGKEAGVQGYVQNRSAMRLGNVRLRVESLNESGQPVGESFGWVIGDVLPGSRGFFVIRVTVPGATYRTSVVSYDTISTPAASPPTR